MKHAYVICLVMWVFVSKSAAGFLGSAGNDSPLDHAKVLTNDHTGLEREKRETVTDGMCYLVKLSLICTRTYMYMRLIITDRNKIIYSMYRAGEVSVHRACCERATQHYSLVGEGTIDPGSRPAGVTTRSPRKVTECHLLSLFEPRHDKTNKVTVRPAKTQISLGIRPV